MSGKALALLFTQIMSLECAGFARDFAEVEDQVRFLAGTLSNFVVVVASSRHRGMDRLTVDS